MKKIMDVAFKVMAGVVLNSAKKEADSACMFIGYQPKMPTQVCELKSNKKTK